jgi:hypothetical protein
MTSRCYAGVPSVVVNDDTRFRMLKSNYTASESETEDEEVRMNCIGGFRGIEDSDMNTTENSDDENDENVSDEESFTDGYVGLAMFVTSPYWSGGTLIRPKPKAPAVKRLSPLDEQDDEPENTDEQPHYSHSYDSSETKSCIAEMESTDAERSGDNAGTTEDLSSSTKAGSEGLEVELTEILASINDALELALDESESSSSYYIGVMKDIDTESPVYSKAKRVLCQPDKADENFKKARVNVMKDLQYSHSPITLMQAFSDEQRDCCHYSLTSLFSLKIREESPALMSNDDDEELDRQLGEELGDEYQGDGQDTPVPLLTPPGSPLTVEWEGLATTLCEWPSNLIVDSAMQAAHELRPMSPTSLENLERDEQHRIVSLSGINNSDFATTSTMLHSPLRFKSVYA